MWDPLPWQYFGLSGVRDFGRAQYTQWSSTESVYCTLSVLDPISHGNHVLGSDF